MVTGTKERFVGMLFDHAVMLKASKEEEWTKIIEISPDMVKLNSNGREYILPEITADGRFVCAVLVAWARRDNPDSDVWKRSSPALMRAAKELATYKRIVRNVVIDIERHEYVVLDDYYPGFCWVK
jgi:hypothetical protein